MNLQDLKKFCSTDHTRPTILKPFTQDGFTFATDGRILVRIPAIEGGADDGPEDSIRVIPSDLKNYQPVQLPPNWESIIQPETPCHTCEGTGSIGKCRHCQGHGEIECETCGHEEYCRPCQGTGKASSKETQGYTEPCEDCDGRGKTTELVKISLNRGACFLDLRYLRLAATLPNLRLRFLDEHSVLRMDFESGDGAIMPIRPGSKEVADIITAKQWSL